MTKTTKTEKTPAKAKKAEKLYPAKKIPAMFRKTYTEKKFDKSIMKHLYIDADKTYVKGLFSVDKATGAYSVPADASFTKKDIAHLKRLSKDIKSQKGTIKLVPLLAVVILLAAIGISVTMFKNVILKKVLVSEFQGIFGAKTDIEKVDLQIFGASLKINGLQQANKDEPMKNLFQIDDIDFDFNLTELLRGKFDAQNLEIAGVATGTDRKTSGELPKKPEEDKKAAEDVKKKQNKLIEEAEAKLKVAFAQYDPQKIIENVQSSLKSPAVAQEIQKQVEPIAAKWKDTPETFKKSVDEFSASAKAVTDTNWGGINDPVKLKAALENVNKAITEGDKLKKQADETMNSLKGDAATVKTLSTQMQSAIASDKALVNVELNKLKSLKAEGVQGIISDMMNTALYALAGKYYPYVRKAMNAALSSKNSASGSKTDNKKKEKTVKTSRRMKGSDIYWKNDNVPKFLIEKAYGSGPNFEFGAKEVSSDMDKRGKPAAFNADFTVLGRGNKLDGTVDARSNTETPLLAVSYAGSNWPVDISVPNFSMKSTSGINCKITGKTDGSFSLAGSMNMKGVQLATPEFSPAAVYALYQKALASFSTMDLGFTASYTKAGGLDVQLDPSIANQFAAVFQKMLTSELASITADAETKVTSILSEKTGIATDKIQQFTDIQGSINTQKGKVDSLNAQLEKSKKQIADQIKKQAGGAVKSAGADALRKLF